MSVVLKRKFIIEQHEMGMQPSEIFKLGKTLKINRMLIKRTIDCYQETSTIEDRSRSGRPRTSRTPKLIKKCERKNQAKSKKIHETNGERSTNFSKNYEKDM